MLSGPISFDIVIEPDAGHPAWSQVLQFDFVGPAVASATQLVPYPNVSPMPEVAVTPTATGFHVVVTNYNPGADLPRTSYNGTALRPDLRYFTNFEVGFRSLPGLDYPPLSASDGDWFNFDASIRNVRATTGSGVPITVQFLSDNDAGRGVVPPCGGFSNSWTRSTYGFDMVADEFGWEPPTGDRSTDYNWVNRQGSEWDASPHIAPGRWIQSSTARESTDDAFVCLAVNSSTRLAGPVGVIGPFYTLATASDFVLEYTTDPVDPASVDCSRQTWHRIAPSVIQHFGTSSVGEEYFAVDLAVAGVNPSAVSGLRARTSLGRLVLYAVHSVTAASDMSRGVWTTGSYSDDGGATWITVTSPQTDTPGATFPATTGARDVVWTAPWYPAVTKTVSKANPEFQEPVDFTVTATALTNGPTDVVPLVVRDEVQPDLTLVAGSATGNPTITTGACTKHPAADPCTILTWQFNATFNTPVEFTYTATADWANGTRYNTAWVTNLAALGFGPEWEPSTANGALAEVAVNRLTTGITRLSKDVTNEVAALDAVNTWTLRLSNNDSVPEPVTDVIDELPFNGDGRGTSYHGTYAISAVTTTDGAAVWYTTETFDVTDPALRAALVDPASEVNGGFGTPAASGGRWLPWPPAWGVDPTAITGLRFVNTTPLPAGMAATYTITWQPDGARPGDTFENYAVARMTSTVLRMVNAAVNSSVEEPSRLQVDKTPGVYDPEAGTMTWQVTAKNAGDQIAVDVLVHDQLGEHLSNPRWERGDDWTSQPDLIVWTGPDWVIDRLEPGQERTATVIADVDRDAVSGPVVNTVTISSEANPVPEGAGTANVGVDADTDQWDQTQFVFPNPELTLVKEALVDHVAAPGVDVPYRFTVTNTGNVTLTHITLTDSRIAGLDCQTDTLVVGEQMICTGTWANIPAAELVDGVLDNQARATGEWEWPNGDGGDDPGVDGPTRGPGETFDTGTVSDDDDVELPYVPVPDPQVTKTAEMAEDGRTVTYTVTATNLAYGPWASPVLDDLAGVLDDADLVADAAGVVFRVTSTVDPVWVIDGATPAPSSWTMTAGDLWGTSVLLANGLTPGQTVTATYTVVIHGAGDRVLDNIAWTPPVCDPATDENCPPPPPPPCDPETDENCPPPPPPCDPAVEDCAPTPPCDPADEDCTPPPPPDPCEEGDPLCDDTQHPLTPPALTLVKTQSLSGADPGEAGTAHLGDVVTYQVTVTNTGQTAYVGPLVDVLDDVLDDATVVAVDGVVFTVVTTVDGAAVGTPVTFAATDVTDGVLTYAHGVPAGGAVTLTFAVTITATGDGDLFNLAAAPLVTDPDGDGPGEPVVPNPKDFEDADGDGLDDETGSPMDTVILDTTVSLVLDKQVTVTERNGIDGNNAGDQITWTFVVTNTGDRTLTDVTVHDPTVGDVTLAATTLAPGESTTGTVTRELTAADETAGQPPGQVVNTAYATGVDPTNPHTPVESNEDTTITPLVPLTPAHLTLVKSQAVNGQPVAKVTTATPGQVVTYQVVATNSGQTPWVGPLVDVLTDVLDDATLVPFDGAATFTVVTTVGGEPVASPVTYTARDITAGVLTYADGVPAGGVVTLTFTVTVTATGDGDLFNLAAAPIPHDPDGDGPEPPTIPNPRDFTDADGDGLDDTTGSPMDTVAITLPTTGTGTGSGGGSGDTPLLYTGGASNLPRTGMSLSLALCAALLTLTGTQFLRARRHTVVAGPDPRGGGVTQATERSSA